MIRRCGIALGSNLGDSAACLREAIERLRAISVPGEPVCVAPFYRTTPLACPPGSPDFLNSVIEIARGGTALELLHETRQIEAHMGRIRGPERNAPRTIDIDLLYFGDETVHCDELTLPHPRLTQRRFVLQPLADIRPELILPGQLRCVREILHSLDSDEPPLVPLE